MQLALKMSNFVEWIDSAILLLQNRNHYFFSTMKIGIFCSANDNIDPVYFEKTTELGHLLAEKGHSIVFGGSNKGLMECIAKAMHDKGGTTIGVIPRLLEQGRRVSDHVDVNIACDDLTDRKALMMAQSDIFIALPGGVGTLDEIMTVAASHSIGYHQKKVILYNINGFWDPLITLLDGWQASGLMREPWHTLIEVATTLDEIDEMVTF